MKITKKIVAQKIESYLHHEITQEQLVGWAESALMEGDFEEAEMDALRTVIARLGVADVRAFGLTWEDCERLLALLGFTARVEIASA